MRASVGRKLSLFVLAGSSAISSAFGAPADEQGALGGRNARAPIQDVRFSPAAEGLGACIMRAFEATGAFPRFRYRPSLAGWVKMGDGNALRSMACGMTSEDSFYCYQFYLISLDRDGWKMDSGEYWSRDIVGSARIAMPAVGLPLGELPLTECIDALRPRSP